MTDIMHMLQQAQAQACKAQSQEQNSSVASFFSSLANANSKQSTNPTQSMPIPIAKSQSGFTLESIERNIPKISPPPPQHHDSHGSHQVDLMANSPLAQFISSNNLSALQRVQEPPSAIVNGAGNSLSDFKTAASVQVKPAPMANGTKESGKETKLLITPNMLTEKKQPQAQQQQQSAAPLSKNQMIQALKYLIDNDNDFTKKIHDAYLKSACK